MELVKRHDFDPFIYHKGVFISLVEEAILAEAGEIGLPINGRGRGIRLTLASELVGRKIKSFNDLRDGEIWDIRYWCLHHRQELRKWLKEEYGYQEALL